MSDIKTLDGGIAYSTTPKLQSKPGHSSRSNIKPPAVVLNVPSTTKIEYPLSPNNKALKLKSPYKASQEELELTKRYIGVNDQIK